MSNYQPASADKDPQLWKLAQKRVSFKKHVFAYIAVNVFMWAVWYFTSNVYTQGIRENFPWPIWTTVGWGIGLAAHFSEAYFFPKVNAAEREYQKLKNKQ